MSMQLRNLFNLHRLQNEAGENGDQPGAGGETDEQKAAREEAERKAAEAATAAEKDKNKGKKPSDEEAKLLKEVMEKKKALQQANDELAQVKEQLKKFEGIDAEKVKTLLKQQEEAEQKQLEAKGEWNKLKAQMNDAHQKALQAKDQEVQSLAAQKAALEQTIAELTVGHAFGNSRFVADEMALTPSKARVVYGSHFEFKDGKVIAYDKPAGQKDRTMLIDGKGDPLSFDEAIRKIVDADPDKDHLLKSKLKPGAGSTTSSKAGAPKPTTDGLTGRAKIAAGLAALKK